MVRALFFLLCLHTASTFGAKAKIATVNGEPVYAGDLKKGSAASSHRIDPEVEKHILFKVAVQEARKQGLENDPAVSQELDKVLYKHFLEKSLKRQGHKLKPSTASLKREYKKYPLVRLRHLALFARTPSEKKKAAKTLRKVQQELKQGKSFKSLVLKYSQDNGAKFAGDLDFRGVHDLPKAFYQAVVSLDVGKISKPINSSGAIHLFKVTARKNFEQAPESYRSFLRGKLQRQKELSFLKDLLDELRKKAKVEISKQGKIR